MPLPVKSKMTWSTQWSPSSCTFVSSAAFVVAGLVAGVVGMGIGWHGSDVVDRATVVVVVDGPDGTDAAVLVEVDVVTAVL